MDFIKGFLEWIVNAEAKFVSKFSLIIGIVILVFVVDNILGFSSSFSSMRELAVAKEATELLKGENLSPYTKRRLLAIRDNALARKNVFEEGYDWVNARFWNAPKKRFSAQDERRLDSLQMRINALLDSANFNSKSKFDLYAHKQKDNNLIVIHNTSGGEDPRSNTWHVISSSAAYLLVGIIMALFCFFAPEVGGFAIRFFAFLAILGLLGGFSWLLSFLFGLIPKIGERWLWNYLLNAVFQTITVFIWVYLSDKAKK